MEFRILGPLEVRDGDRPVPLPRGRGRALLANLILRAGTVVPTDTLIDALWGEAPPRTAATALQGLVSGLRKRIEPGRSAGEAAILRTAAAGYVLDVDPATVDAGGFRRLLDRARGASASERSAILREALALWRGPALADFVYQPFAQREIASLEELRLVALEDRIEADLASGRHHDLVPEIQALIAEHPFRERLHGYLMLALYRAGRQADALDAYRRARHTLVEELGIEPGPALRELEQAILRQDASLEPGAGPTAGGRSVGEPWLSGERRTVTALFVEIAPAGDGDVEAVRRDIGRWLDAAAGVLRRHGAQVEELVGDMTVALFGLPIAHEDDALRALRAAVELRAALPTTDDAGDGSRLLMRAGVETGEVVVAAGDPQRSKASGPTVTAAARLQQAARVGDVLVGPGTRRLTDGAAALQQVEDPALTGPGAPATAWLLVDVDRDAPAVQRRPDAPLVGRAAELERLKAAFEGVIRRGRGFRFTVLGDAGVGKSRLGAEFTAGIAGEARVLTGHCPAYGQGITFWPLREIVVAAAGGRDRDRLAALVGTEDDGAWIADQVAAAIGLAEGSDAAEDLFPAVRRLFESLSRQGPVVVTVEDLHWAQPMFLELLSSLAENVCAPVLFLGLARPELIESRPAWGAGGRAADTLFLEPLAEEETRRLITLRAEALPDQTRARIAETAQGNPLFAEQMIAAFLDEGTTALPATVHSLLAARLDRLGPAERDLLRCAAVLGLHFTSDALAALVPVHARAFIDRHLDELDRRHLIRADPAAQTFRFRHGLIQLAAYRSATREDRAVLHQRFAEWLEHGATEPPPELDEILGHHLEQAVLQRRLLGDQPHASLVARAGERLATAGMRAWKRHDNAAAENLMSRARALLAADHPRWREVMQVLADAYPPLGRHEEADAVLSETLTQVAGDRALERAIRVKRARIRLDTGRGSTDVGEIRTEAEQAFAAFASSGEHAGAAQAAHVLVNVLRVMGDTREIERVVPDAFVHTDRSELLREELGLRYALVWAGQAGETPVVDAIARCGELAWRNGTLHPGVLAEEAILRAMLGEAGRARELVIQAKTHSVEVERVRRPLMFVIHNSAVVEMLAGDTAAAERDLRTALRMALDMGEGDQLAHVAAHLSRLLSGSSRHEDAERFASMSRDAAPIGSVSQALWRAAAARSLAHRDPHQAERLGLEAVGLAPAPMPGLRAGVLMDLAEVHRDPARAEAARDEALGLYERKGNVVSAARVRALV